MTTLHATSGKSTPEFNKWVQNAKGAKIEDIATRRLHLSLSRSSSGQMKGPCPHCRGNDRFYIDTRKNYFECHHCLIGKEGTGNDPIGLVRAVRNCSFVEACYVINGTDPPIPKNEWAEQRQEYEKIKAKIAAKRTELKAISDPPIRQPWQEQYTVESYVYRDEHGIPLYKINRVQYRTRDGTVILEGGKPKKAFKAYRREYDEDGNFYSWEPCLKEGQRRIPYRLPELIKAVARSEIIFFVEGERKADFISEELGLAATCVAFGGVGGWNLKYDYKPWFDGAKVAILPDNDPIGFKFAARVAEDLQGSAASVLIVNLPGLPAKGDIIDWVQG